MNLALHEIVGRLPRVVNPELQQALSRNLNDNYLTLYVSSLAKNVTNVHELLNNRIKNFEDSIKVEKKEENVKSKTADVKA